MAFIQSWMEKNEKEVRKTMAALPKAPTLDDLHKLLLSLQERIESLEWQISQRQTLREKKKTERIQHKSAIDQIVEKASQQGMGWQRQLYKAIKEGDRGRFFD